MFSAARLAQNTLPTYQTPHQDVRGQGAEPDPRRSHGQQRIWAGRTAQSLLDYLPRLKSARWCVGQP